MDPTVLLEMMDLLDYLVYLEKWAREAFLVLEVLLDFQDPLVYPALKEARAQKEMRDHLDLLDHRDKRVVKDQLDLL